MAWRLNELHGASERESGREREGGMKVVKVLSALLTKWHGIFQGKHAEFCIPKESDNANREKKKERERSKGKNEKSKLIRFYSSPYTAILLWYPMNASSNCVINEFPHGPQCAPPPSALPSAPSSLPSLATTSPFGGRPTWDVNWIARGVAASLRSSVARKK